MKERGDWSLLCLSAYLLDRLSYSSSESVSRTRTSRSEYSEVQLIDQAVSAVSSLPLLFLLTLRYSTHSISLEYIPQDVRL